MKTLVKRTNPIFSSFPSILDEFLFNPEMRSAARTQLNPLVNIKETSENFQLSIAVPGYKKEEIHLQIENDILFVSSEKQEETNSENENFTRKEFHFASFKRSFTLPDLVDTEKIEATCNEGILKIILPKKVEILQNKVKSISIQ